MFFIRYTRDCAPGQRECDESVDKLNHAIRTLDQASLAAISQSLPHRREKSLRVGYLLSNILQQREHNVLIICKYGGQAFNE